MKPNQNGLVTQIPIKNKAGKVIGHKEVVTYRGLLARAHDEHLVGIETTVVQFPSDGNDHTAVVQATLKAVREADPQATIVAPASSGFPWEFFESLFAAPGVLENLDGVSVHPYRSYSQGPETAVKDYTRLRSLIGTEEPSKSPSRP